MYLPAPRLGSLRVTCSHKEQSSARDAVNKLLPAHLALPQVVQTFQHALQTTLSNIRLMDSELPFLKQLLAQGPEHLAKLVVLLLRWEIVAELGKLLSHNRVTQCVPVVNVLTGEFHRQQGTVRRLLRRRLGRQCICADLGR